MEKKYKVLSVGVDLSNNGGIASVVKVLYNVKDKKYDYTLLKTCYYKDKGLVFKLQIAIIAILKYLRFLISNQFSIVHIHSSSRISFYRKSFFLLLAKLFRRKTILQIHSSDFDDFFINTKGIKKTFIKLILSQPDKIFVLCNDWKNKIREKYSLNAEVIYNPINLKPIQANRPKPQTLNILFLGFFIPSKGIDDLLKVIQYYKKDKHPKFVMHICTLIPIIKNMLKKKSQIKSIYYFSEDFRLIKELMSF